MAISKKLRFDVFKRDRFTCQYCGRTPPAVTLECDHIQPVSGGGSDDELNLVTSCFDCNRGKAAGTLDTYSQPLIEQQKRIIEQKEQFQAYSQQLDELKSAENETIKQVGRYWFDSLKGGKSKLVFGISRVPSVRRFLESLPVTEVMEAVEIAIAKCGIRCSVNDDEKAWKYFCGVCWKKIKDRGGD